MAGLVRVGVGYSVFSVVRVVGEDFTLKEVGCLQHARPRGWDAEVFPRLRTGLAGLSLSLVT